MERLRQLREERRMTQLRLSMELDVSQQRISKIETGQTDPSASLIRRISQYFNVSADYLLEMTDNREIRRENKAGTKTDYNVIDIFTKLPDRDKDVITLLIEYYDQH